MMLGQPFREFLTSTRGPFVGRAHVRSCLLLLTIATVAASAQDAPEKPTDPEVYQGPCVDVRVTSPLSSGIGNDPEGPRPFSLSRVIDLNIQVYLRPDFDGADLVTLRIYSPQGHLYQEMAVPFSTDPGRTGAQRGVEGYPRPLDVRPVEIDRSGDSGVLTVPFPVGGTMISSRNIVGRWRVEALFGESRAACADSANFSLVP